MRLRSTRLTAGCFAFAVVLAGAAFGVPSTAQAASTWPGAPSGVHVSARSMTAFTVVLDHAANATSYRLAESTVESDLWLKNINTPSANRHVVSASRPSLTLSGLDYTSATLYYRVATVNGSRVHWWSRWSYLHLVPPVPSTLAAQTSDWDYSAGTTALYVTWDQEDSGGYDVERADDPAFTSGVTVTTTSDNTGAFSPDGLAAGQQYWFRVRARNANTTSAWTAAVTGTQTMTDHHLRILTYNVLSAGYDGTMENGNVVAPWTQRLPGVAANINSSDADIVCVEEAGGVTAPGRRQADDIADAIQGSGYALYLVDDEAPQGDYIYFKPSVLTQVGYGESFSLGYGYHAAYALFSLNGTGARVLITCPHLDASSSASDDQERQQQTYQLIDSANWIGRYYGVTSIVFAGDYNAWPGRWHAVDTPGQEMASYHDIDSNFAAPTHYNQQYASINGYLRTAPLGGAADRIFVTPGTTIRLWGEKVPLHNGQFVGTIPSDHNPVLADLGIPIAPG